MSLKIKYIDVPQGVQEAARAEGPGQPFSEADSLISGVQDAPFATLEPQGWPLDGKRQLLADDPEDFWWSTQRSDENGDFQDPPVVILQLAAPCRATGLSFTFWPSAGQWCSKLRVSWLAGNRMLAQTVAYPDGPRWTLQQTVEDFDKVRIELLATNIAGQFAKISHIIIGQTLWFDKDRITAVEMVNEIDPTLSQLTVDTMTVTLRDTAGLTLAPQENQRVELYRGETLLAVQYITQSQRQSKWCYRLHCQSAVGLLEDTYLGGLFDAVPAAEVLGQILGQTAYELDPFFAEKTVTGYLPVCTRRQALQQVAFAIGGVVTTQGSGRIRIVPLAETTSHKFLKSQMFTGGTVETASRIARVEVVSHGYTPSGEETVLLDGEQVNGQDVLFTWDAPCHSYGITGGSITGSGANWVTVTAQGPVRLTGKKYIHSTQCHSKRDPGAAPQEQNNVLAVEDATLVHRGNVQQVLQRLYDISRLRQTLSRDAVISGQRAGQKVAADSPWEGQIRGYITSMESRLTPTGHTAAVKIIGAEAPAETAVMYAGELYAADKEVLYGCI